MFLRHREIHELLLREILHAFLWCRRQNRLHDRWHKGIRNLLLRAVKHALLWYDRQAVLHDLRRRDTHNLLQRTILHALPWYKKRSFNNRLPDLGHWHGPNLLPDKPIHVPLHDLWREHTPDLLHDSFQPPNPHQQVTRSRGINVARRRSNVAARRVPIQNIVVKPTSPAQHVRTCCAAEASGHTCWAAHVWF